MRALDEWTDRRYHRTSPMHHRVAFGDRAALCGADATEMFGTGSMDEIERAQRLYLCSQCEDHIRALEKPPRQLGSDVDPAVATWAQAMNDTTPPREKGTPC